MIKTPRYVQARVLASDETGYFWSAPSWARKQQRDGRDCPILSEPLGCDIPAMFERAKMLNDIFDSWKNCEQTGPAHGSVDWLFAWYRGHDRFKKLKDRTREDYRSHMDLMAGQKMKYGVLGTKQAAKVTASVADTMYKRITNNNGPSAASHAMRVCRLIWNLAIRYDDQTGIKNNPFTNMRLSIASTKGNRATTRAEYDLYRQTARDMGYQSMATAAALSFGFGQRVSDVFGYSDQKDRDVPAMSWSHYKPGISFSFVQNKRGKAVEIPLTAVIDGETVSLYPDVEEELARTPRRAMVIIVEERTGLPYAKRRVTTVHRKICDKAGLPKDMTPTGFRHGALTEMGDSGVRDARSIAGHSDIATTTIYNKVTAEKARQIGEKRLRHVRKLQKEG